MSQPPEFPRYSDRPEDRPQDRQQDRPQDGPQEVPDWVPPSTPHPQQPYAGGPEGYPQQYAAPSYGQPQQYAASSYGQPQQYAASSYGQPQQYGAPAPYGYDHGYGYSGTAAPGTSGLAIAALITGLVGLGPIPLGLGVGALLTIRRSRQSGTGMAVAGVVLGALQTLVFGLFFVLGFAGALDEPVAEPGVPAPVQSTAEPYTMYLDELTAGECFDETDKDFEVVRQPCGTPHDGEVYASLVLPPHAYPGDRALRDEAQASCDREFTGYVGVDAHHSRLESDLLYPDREMWEDDERDVMCLVYGPDAEQLVGSVKGSKR
jgi:Domain of unknown function (DUF4190)/Septum formation